MSQMRASCCDTLYTQEMGFPETKNGVTSYAGCCTMCGAQLELRITPPKKKKRGKK